MTSYPKQHVINKGRPVRYLDNIMYRDNSTVIAIQHLQFAIVITATKTVVGYK